MKHRFLAVLLLCLSVFSLPMARSQATFIPRKIADIAFLQSAIGVSAKSFGAKGDGVTNDRAALQRAIDALPSGGKLILDAGNYVISSRLNITKQITVQGQGAGFTDDTNVYINLPMLKFAATRITTSGTTAEAFLVTEGGCKFNNFAIYNTSAVKPTAGYGIKMTKAHFAQVDQVTIDNFYINLEVTGGWYYSVTNCHILSSAKYGIKITNSTLPDAGDMLIHGCYFYQAMATWNADAAIRWESGGGLRVIGCKVNAGLPPLHPDTEGLFANGIDCNLANAVFTSVFVITGNSIENCRAGGAGIVFGTQGATGSVGKVVITGNEIAINSAGISVQSATVGILYGFEISANVFTDNEISMQFQNVNGLHVGKNSHYSLLVAKNAVILGAGCLNFDVDPQLTSQDSVYLYSNLAAQGVAHGAWQQTPQEFAREIPQATNSTTFTNLYKIQVGNKTSGTIKITLSGYVLGLANGTYTIRKEIAFFREAAGNTTIATIGTNYAGGSGAANVELEFDATSGIALAEVWVKVRYIVTGGATNVVGTLNMTTTGIVYSVKKGN